MSDKLHVGATVWQNRRPVKITGETSRSWLVGDHKIPKAQPLDQELRVSGRMTDTLYLLSRSAFEADVLARISWKHSDQMTRVHDAIETADNATKLRVLEALGLTLDDLAAPERKRR